MIKKIVLISIFALFSVSTASEAADWLYFIENAKGDKYYIDIDSLKRTSPDTVRVSRKIEPGNRSKISYLVSHVEMNCKKSNIRLLKETTHYRNGKSKTGKVSNKAKKITAEDIEEALLELVCSLKKRE